MKRIITVQHCQAVHHVNNMVGGITDWELTELGCEQAKISLSSLEKTAFLGSAGVVSFMSERDDNARVLNVWIDTSYILPIKEEFKK